MWPWTSSQLVWVLAWQCHLLAGCFSSEISALSFHLRCNCSRKVVNLTENDSVYEKICAWKMSFWMVNLNKILCFRNESRQGNCFVWFECSFTFIYNCTLRIIPFPIISSALCQLKVVNIDLASGISLLLSFLPVLEQGLWVPTCPFGIENTAGYYDFTGVF